MAQKSSNTKGNPYHDEGTGQFTNAEGGSTQSKSELVDGSKHFSIRLKSNFNLNDARSDLQQTKTSQPQQPTIQPIGQYREATSIQDAMAVGRSILPDCLVNYSEKCDLAKVNELNKALSDITNRFPGFVQNGLLNAYGDGLSLSEQDIMHTITQSALNVVQKDKYFSQLYDEFFNESKARFGLKDEDKYNEQVFRHFMRFDSQFNAYDYTKKFSGGGALAYYQVSQDNIYNPGQGGKGINGAIKFYTSILQKATPQEINDEAYSVRSGFHFDYGGHSYTYATGVHELGHSIFTIAYKKCTDEEKAELNQLLKDGVGKDRREVSGYGHTNAYEQEAEAVADAMCRGDNATPHNRKMIAWLDKVHARLKNAGEI